MRTCGKCWLNLWRVSSKNSYVFKDCRHSIRMAFTPLSIAAQIGDVQDVLTLLEAGAVQQPK